MFDRSARDAEHLRFFLPGSGRFFPGKTLTVGRVFGISGRTLAHRLYGPHGAARSRKRTLR